MRTLIAALLIALILALALTPVLAAEPTPGERTQQVMTNVIYNEVVSTTLVFQRTVSYAWTEYTVDGPIYHPQVQEILLTATFAPSTSWSEIVAALAPLDSISYTQVAVEWRAEVYRGGKLAHVLSIAP